MEFIEKEEQEVRRQSSINPRAASLATQHRRYSLMQESGRGGDSIDEKGPADNNHKEVA